MDTIAMDTNPFMVSSALVAEGVLTRRDPALSPNPGKAGPRPRRFSARPGQANDGEKAHLRTSIRRAIIAFIAHLSPARIAPKSRLRSPRP